MTNVDQEQQTNRFLLKSLSNQLVGLTTEDENSFVMSMNLSSGDGSPRPFMEFLIQVYRLLQVNTASLSRGDVEVIIRVEELQKILHDFLVKGQLESKNIGQIRIYIQEGQVYFQRVTETNPEHQIIYSFPLSHLSEKGIVSMLVGLNLLKKGPNPAEIVIESTTLFVLFEMIGQTKGTQESSAA